MLPIESVTDHKAIFVEVVQDPVSVVRHCGRKHDDFVVERHFLEEFDRARPDEVAALLIVIVLIKVYQGLIKVKYKRVYFTGLVFLREWRQVRNSDLRAEIFELSINLCLLLIRLIMFCVLEVAAAQEARSLILIWRSFVVFNLLLVVLEAILCFSHDRNERFVLSFHLLHRSGFISCLNLSIALLSHYLRLLERPQTLVLLL